MKNRRISLLDIGLDSSFDAAMAFVQGVLQSLNAGYDEPVVDIDFVRSRDPDTVLTALTASCDVLHVMAHGDHSITPTFSSSDERTNISLEHLGERAAEQRRGISTGAILAERVQDRNRRLAEGRARLPSGRRHLSARPR